MMKEINRKYADGGESYNSNSILKITVPIFLFVLFMIYIG